jgi:hypothetical protein
MGHRAGEKQIPVALPPDVIRELQIAAIKMQADVPRERALNRGPMLGYVARWFLTLSAQDQLRVVRAGKAIEDVEKGASPSKGDDEDFARRLLKGETSTPKAQDARLGEDRSLGTVNIPIYGRKGKRDGGAGPGTQARSGRFTRGEK